MLFPAFKYALIVYLCSVVKWFFNFCLFINIELIMPLYKIIQEDKNTKILIWKITESLSELFSEVSLRDICLERLENMRSECHKKGFLSIRKLLRQAGYTDFDLFYDQNGKPNLKDGKHISITHSGYFSAIVISNKNTGVDIELQREKIIRIAHKFTETELRFLNLSNAEQSIRWLTIIWSTKESVYKFYSINGLSLKKHITIFPFDLDLNKKNVRAVVSYKDLSQEHQAKFIEFEKYTLVYLV